MSSTKRKRGTYKDFYPTPRTAIEPLAKEITWRTEVTIHEPCLGTGIILDVLEEYATDAETSWCEIDMGKDFFDHRPGEMVPRDCPYQEYVYRSEPYDYIVTNPPFSQAQRFIDKSLAIAHTVIMLLPMGFLGSELRRPWWPFRVPTGFYVLSHRPSFQKNGHSDSSTYAWFVWDRTGDIPTGAHWL